ncbi:MAG: prepilin-type N-terminal cleavage/methylation domain-containing protein [Gammaproteobacteria bacterium]|nr:prepilin-type N-terminal cleavage/methylation domain-containing protein [Gammaproteobacteria bacterium]MCH9763827.1 prepilin-type N-terminal cleavage/methylation domain-containing protein [Gammaproteobacteria bacterium]
MKNGFSLIELMCVLGLIALLTTFAYPNYTRYLVHARHIDAQSALLDLATRLEQYHCRAHTYQTATLGTGQSTDVLSQNISPGGHYQLHITKATASYYALEAIPIGPQARLDKQHPHFKLDANGQS